MKKNVVSIKKKSGDDIVTDLIQNLMEAHIKEWEANSGEELINDAIGTAARNVTDCQNDHDEEDND